LYKALSRHVDENGLGEVFFGGGIFLEDNSHVVIPDIYFISKKKRFSVEVRGVFGAPDLVIEILPLATSSMTSSARKISTKGPASASIGW